MSGHPTVLFPQGSSDVGLAAAFRRPPEPLRVALVEHVLDHAGILEAFPRKPLALLGILGAETARTATLDTGMPTGSGTGILRTLATGYSIVVFF